MKDERTQGKAPIPDIVIGRLPVYLRTLRLLAEDGREVTSSQELGEHLGISSAQIRKDLSHFGEFGKQGTGYNIDFLCRQLQKILNVDRIWPVMLIGAGSLGTAIANYQEFESSGFRIVSVLDEGHPESRAADRQWPAHQEFRRSQTAGQRVRSADRR